MRADALKRVPMLLTALGFALSLCLLAVVQVSAQTKPTVQVKKGDVFAGGWFGNGNSCLGPSYQEGTSGGIMTFANSPATPGSSSSEFAAFALGLIEGNNTGYGFLSQTNSTKNLTFANDDATDVWGGMFGGGAGALPHCIPDYYTTMQQPAGSTTVYSGNQNDLKANGKRSITGNVTLNALTIDKNINSTLFVFGNLYINDNIMYGPHEASTAPKFAVVVKGNIYVRNNVTQLDGWYIAQPSAGTSDGEVWTCSDGTANTLTNPTAAWIKGNCGQQLVINGAVSSKKLNLIRVSGDVSSSPAEVINYTSDMITGGSFFGNTNTQAAGTIQNLTDLPPVF